MGRLLRSLRWSRPPSAAWLFLTPAVFMALLVFAYPILQILRASLLDRGRNQFVGLANYASLTDDPIAWQSIQNNFLLLAVIPVLIGSSILIASILFDHPRGWQIYRTLVFAPYVLSVVVVGIAFDQIYTGRGVLNTVLSGVGLDGFRREWLGDPHTALASVMAVIIWREVGFGVTLFLARLTTASTDLYDAARVDGAGWFAIMRHVTVPHLRPVIAVYAASTMIGMFSWVFGYIYILTRGGPGYSTYVSEYFIYQSAFNYDSLGSAAALASVLLGIVVVAVAFQFSGQRQMGVE